MVFKTIFLSKMFATDITVHSPWNGLQVVEKLLRAVDSSCRTQAKQQTVLNSCRFHTRLIPYIFEVKFRSLNINVLIFTCRTPTGSDSSVPECPSLRALAAWSRLPSPSPSCPPSASCSSSPGWSSAPAGTRPGTRWTSWAGSTAASYSGRREWDLPRGRYRSTSIITTGQSFSGPSSVASLRLVLLYFHYLHHHYHLYYYYNHDFSLACPQQSIYKFCCLKSILHVDYIHILSYFPLPKKMPARGLMLPGKNIIGISTGLQVIWLLGDKRWSDQQPIKTFFIYFL